jgi:zinc transporter, ZIP family
LASGRAIEARTALEARVAERRDPPQAVEDALGVNTTEVAWILAAGFATGLGGLGLLLIRRPSHRMLDTLLGFTAGIMLAASVFSLLVPALDRGSLAEVVGGFLLGACCIGLLDRTVPHLHLGFRERRRTVAEVGAGNRKRAILLLSALTIHNIPEGLAVGVAFAAGGSELGIPIALAIGIQNIPEGFAAGAPLLELGVSRGAAAGVAALTGIVEPPAALAALAAFDVASALLPAALAFAAGAMIYVIADELIPESHARGHELEATIALIAGFVMMMGLDNAFS